MNCSIPTSGHGQSCVLENTCKSNQKHNDHDTHLNYSRLAWSSNRRNLKQWCKSEWVIYSSTNMYMLHEIPLIVTNMNKNKKGKRRYVHNKYEFTCNEDEQCLPSIMSFVNYWLLSAWKICHFLFTIISLSHVDQTRGKKRERTKFFNSPRVHAEVREQTLHNNISNTGQRNTGNWGFNMVIDWNRTGVMEQREITNDQGHRQTEQTKSKLD